MAAARFGRRGTRTTPHGVDACTPQKGATKNWISEDDCHEVYSGLSEVADQLTQFQEQVRQQVAAHLAVVLGRFIQRAADERRQEGMLTFGDLLIEACKLLREDSSVRHGLQERYRFILVDEFQDTDPLQAEIIFLLSADETTKPLQRNQHWTEVTLWPGKLFLVGDPKQSIYRFRRADIEAYARAREVFSQHAAANLPARVESIVQNFRSLPEVVTWVNTVFAHEIAVNEQYPHAQPEYEAIEAYRQAADGPRVFHLYPRDDLEMLPINAVRNLEAEAIARLIYEMVENTGWQIRELSDGTEVERRIQLKDICLLIGSRTKIEIYTNALTQHGIPYILDGGKEFFSPAGDSGRCSLTTLT